MKKITVLFFSFVLIYSGYVQSQSPSITINISGLKEVRGNLLIAFYNNEKDFLTPHKAVYERTVRVTAKTQTVKMQNIARGTYAVAIIHDVNSNGKLDTNFLGIPTEPVGVSRNARNRFGPPQYNDARFEYRGGLLTLNIEMY